MLANERLSQSDVPCHLYRMSQSFGHLRRLFGRQANRRDIARRRRNRRGARNLFRFNSRPAARPGNIVARSNRRTLKRNKFRAPKSSQNVTMLGDSTATSKNAASTFGPSHFFRVSG